MPPASKRPAERVLTRRELNRAVLARQLLLDRSPARIPAALERIGGIQAQYAPSMYIGLFSRLRDLDPAALTRALEQRSVVQGTLMRATIHLVSAPDWWPLTVAVREDRREAWLRYRKRDPSPREMAALARRLRPRLDEGPLHRRQIQELVGDAVRTNGVGMWVDMVRVPPSGTWQRRRADLYAAAEEWLGPPAVEPGEAIDLLVRRYLSGFGPARPTEIADWGGLPVRRLSGSLERLGLRRFRDEEGRELVDLPRAPLPDPETPAPPRFLPVWDATLLVHARRTGILPEEYRPRVFNTRTPHSVNTFLIDGEVAGTWRYEKGGISTEPFGRIPSASRRDLAEEAERLAAFHEEAGSAG